MKDYKDDVLERPRPALQETGNLYFNPNLKRIIGPDPAFTKWKAPRKTIIGWVPSFKSLNSIPFMSDNERIGVSHCTVCADVVSIQRNTETITWFDGVKLRKHTPDFKIDCTDGQSAFVEVKSRWLMRRKDVAWKMATIQAQLKALGMRYILLTERELGHTIRNENVAEMNRAGWPDVPNRQLLTLLRDHFLQFDVSSYGELMMLCPAEEAIARQALMHMAAWNEVQFETSKTITLETIFRKVQP